MNKVICLNFNHSNDQMMQSINAEYQIHYSSGLRDAILFMVDNPDVSHLIFHFKGDSAEYQQTVQIIQDINNFLPIILAPDQNFDQISKDFDENRNAIVIRPNMKLLTILNSTEPNRRKANRINWPLRAHFYNADNPNMTETGQIISLSILGAYIKTPNLDILKNDTIILEIAFTDFKFLVEGKIKRTTDEINQNMPLGFAVEFQNISASTTAYINSLINDKLLSVLLSDNS